MTMRARIRIPLLVVLALGATALVAPGAHASTRPEPPKPLVADAQAAGASGLAGAVCGLLDKPVRFGVNRLIGFMTKGRVQGTLAGSIFDEVGFKPWCHGKYQKLKTRLQRVVQVKPALRRQVGPFVFGLGASVSVASDLIDHFRVGWNEFSLSSPLRHYFLAYRVNGGRWLNASDKVVDIVRVARVVQFAVRVDNTAGTSSPWVYSPVFRVP
jgi:hypothetical protein